MIPTPSAGGVAVGRAGLVLLLALLPAAVAWWRDRRLLRAADDPALPELLATRRRENVRAVAVAAAVMIVFGGAAVAWGLPLLLVLLIAAAYPVRTRLLGETWGFGAYVWHTARSFAGAFGFWIALAYTPIAVDAIVRAAGPGRWWLALGLVPMLLVWEHWYPRVWLRAHAARPLASAELRARFDEIIARAGTVTPGVYCVGPQGSRFVNAVALPSARRPAVAMGNALLELLEPDETAAIFAHEMAHFDHFTRRYIRRSQLATRGLILAGVALPLVAIFAAPAMRGWVGWLWPVAMLFALARRASKSQQHETESDLRAAALCGDPEALVRGLVKLHLHARIPRRWAVDVEQEATHPSLVRRIQAIRGGGAAAVEQLGAATVVRSPREGSWVVLDEARAYWLDGVASGTPPELTALREAASSYRAVNYHDLIELRVAAGGDRRALRARAHTGDAWSVPLAPEDVARVQRTLDVVDVRLGRSAGATAPAVPRLVALAAAVALLLTGQAGVALVPLALVLWRPDAPSLAALGVVSIVRAAFGVLEGSYVLTAGQFHLTLLALAATGAGALYLAARQVRSGVPAVNLRLTIVGLAAVAAIAAVSVIAQVMGAVGASLMGAPRVGTLATALAGMAAALLTARRPRARRLAFGGLAAAALVGTMAVDTAALSLRGALAETTARATLLSEQDLGGQAHGLRVSPNGASFAATRVPAGRRSGRGADLTVIVGRIGGATRDVRGVSAEFVDDERLLVLDRLDRGVELRLERVDGTAPPLWADTLADFDPAEPRLLVDADAGSWTVVGGDADTDGIVLLAGGIGAKGHVRRVVVPDTLAMMGDPIVFGPAATVIVPASSLARRPASALWFLGLGGPDYLRADLLLLEGDRVRSVASLRGPPQCGPPAGGVAACVVRRVNVVSLYTVRADGRATELAQRPARDLGAVAAGPGPRVASVTFDGTLVVADLAARRLTSAPAARPGDYPAEIQAGAGWLVTLSFAGDRASIVRRYGLHQ